MAAPWHAQDIYQLSRNWADLVKRARGKALSPDEYNSGTFTISNLGMFGAQSFDAILPPGEPSSRRPPRRAAPRTAGLTLQRAVPCW